VGSRPEEAAGEENVGSSAPSDNPTEGDSSAVGDSSITGDSSASGETTGDS
jgi:hypothetical protein